MVSAKDKKHEELAKRSKYAALYNHLRQTETHEWETTFREIETILGFPLPASARLHRPWWGNQKNSNGHSQALAWSTAGWNTTNVHLENETLVFRRSAVTDDAQTEKPLFNIDEILPPRNFGPWPDDFSLRREDIYPDRM